jgi:hypothetical protein
MKLEDMWFAGSRKGKVSNGGLGPILLPPPPTKEVNQVKVFTQQIMDWVNCGNEEMEREIWNLLAEYANKQAERPIIKKCEPNTDNNGPESKD